MPELSSDMRLSLLQPGYAWLRYVVFACVLATFALFFGSSASANDVFPGTTISGSGSVTSNNTGAGSDAGEPTTDGNTAFQPLNTIWYSWTAPANGTLVVQTCGSTQTSFDTVLGIFTGTAVNALTQVAASDDANNCAVASNQNYGSSITLAVTSGTTYRIQVDGYGGITGAYNLQYAFTAPQPITVLVTDGTATEGGDTASFTVRLGSAPTANVTVAIGADATGQCTFAPTSLTFTTANWATAQTVTATAVNDTVAEGDHSCTTGAITATGGGFTGQTGTAPTISITDNDSRALVIINTDNSAAEGGGTGAFTVRLLSAPTANATVTIAADSTGQCTFAPATLTFTTANWNTAQTVTTTAVNDVIVEAAHSCATGAIAASGGGYTGVTGTAPTFTITDNDTGTITVTTTTATATEGGATGAFTVVLGLQPSASVTVTIAADASGQCTFAPTTLTFTTANWATAQTVTTTAVNDVIVEGAHSCATGAVAASGGGYTGVTGAAPTFSIADNDLASITVAKNANVASVAAAGAVINYTVQVTNTGNVPATAISVTDTLVPVTCPTSGTNTIALLAASASETCTASYTVTQADFDNNGGGDGDIDNSASASGTSGGVAVGASNAAAVLCTQNASLIMVKSADQSGPLVAGQVVRYYFTVTNNGNVTMGNISATDTAFNGNNGPLGTPVGEVLTDVAPLGDSTDATANNGTWTTLKPGDSVRFQVDYTVSQTDIDLVQ